MVAKPAVQLDVQGGIASDNQFAIQTAEQVAAKIELRANR
jgi:hypothetical protein